MKVRDGFLFIISMALLAAFCYSVISGFMFLDRAERGVGVVREVWAKNGRCGGRSRHRCTKFFATVEFPFNGRRQFSRLDAGEVRKHDQHVVKALYQPGRYVRIIFDPNRPEKIRDDRRWSVWRPSIVLLGLQILFLVLSFRDPELSEPITLKLSQG